MYCRDTRRDRVRISAAEAVNWVFFCADTYSADDYSPAVTGARWPMPVRHNSYQWRWWREIVWNTCAAASPDRVGRISVGVDGDDFDSLSEWPELQGRCRQRWAAFRRWWPMAKQEIVWASTNSSVGRILRSARSPEQEPLTLHVVALRAPQDLARNGSHHIVSLGLLQHTEAFRVWLTHQE